MGFPGGSDSKESTCNAGDLGSIHGLEDALKEGMATHSSILAWRIPWTEEPGGLQSTGSQNQTQPSDLHLCSLCSAIESLLSIEWEAIEKF